MELHDIGIQQNQRPTCSQPVFSSMFLPCQFITNLALRNGRRPEVIPLRNMFRLDFKARPVHFACAEPCRDEKTAFLKSSSAVQRAYRVPNKSATCQLADSLGLKAWPAGSYLSENEHPAIVVCCLYIVAHIFQERYVIGTQSTRQ